MDDDQTQAPAAAGLHERGPMLNRQPYDPKKVLFGLLVVSVLVMLPYLRAKSTPGNYEFGGQTMGTYFKVQIARTDRSTGEVRAFTKQVDHLLGTINRQMSTYDPESQISRFNASSETNAPFSVAPQFARVAGRALAIAQMTGGAFDPTVGPLVEVWGFADERTDRRRIPSAEAIEAARSRSGASRLTVSTNSIRKAHPETEIDLSAIAKGYAADAITELATRRGFENVFVEVGGEIAALGSSPARSPWRVAIEVPRHGAPVGADPWFATVTLSDAGIATSGDYRNYFESEGRLYGHIIDPRTGYPISNGVASVSVIARDCMTADALATALTVMGPDAGITLVEASPGIEALFILRTATNTLSTLSSSGFSMKRGAPHR